MAKSEPVFRRSHAFFQAKAPTIFRPSFCTTKAKPSAPAGSHQSSMKHSSESFAWQAWHGPGGGEGGGMEHKGVCCFHWGLVGWEGGRILSRMLTQDS